MGFNDIVFGSISKEPIFESESLMYVYVLPNSQRQSPLKNKENENEKTLT